MYTLDATQPTVTLSHDFGALNKEYVLFLTALFSETVQGLNVLEFLTVESDPAGRSFDIFDDVEVNSNRTQFIIPMALQGDGVYNLTLETGAARDTAGNLIPPSLHTPTLSLTRLVCTLFI